MLENEPLVLRVSKYYGRFALGSAIVGCVIIALMMLSTTCDTVLRYVFNSPIRGVFELNEVILPVCVLMGVAWCQMERGHIRVTIMLTRLSPRKVVIMDTIVWVVTLAFVMTLAIQTWHDAVYAYSVKMFRFGVVQMPTWWVRGLVPIGLALLCIQLILDIWVNIWRLIGRLPLQIPELRPIEQEKSNEKDSV